MTIATLRPGVIIETGTFEGGSAIFYADLLDRLGGGGRVVTIDSAPRSTPTHTRVTYLVGDSTSPGVIDQVHAVAAQASGPVMVILDSDHSESHVERELEAYSPFVTPGSFLLVQDGVIDRLGFFRAFRPGPSRAIQRFIVAHPEFEIDRERCGRFLITDHPDGWLRRRTGAVLANGSRVQTAASQTHLQVDSSRTMRTNKTRYHDVTRARFFRDPACKL